MVVPVQPSRQLEDEQAQFLHPRRLFLRVQPEANVALTALWRNAAGLNQPALTPKCQLAKRIASFAPRQLNFASFRPVIR